LRGLSDQRTKWRFVAPLVLLLAVILGFITHHDYGVGWDEETQREIGTVSCRYVAGVDNELQSYVCRDHGVIFEMLLVAAEKIGRASSFREIFFLRHMVSHLFFLVGLFFFYKLGLLLYRSWWPALMAMLLVLLHPVLYGHSFFNSKDIPFLSLLMICFYAHARVVTQRSWLAVVVCGILVGLLVNIRLTGLLFLALFTASQFLAFSKRREWKRGVITSIVFVAVALFSLYSSWPYLWNDPFRKFSWLFGFMSSFPFDLGVLFMGEFKPAPELPWYYVPWWFIMNTPILYLLAGATGLVLLFCDLLSKRQRTENGFLLRQHVLFALSFVLPVVVILVLDAVVYDGWRHLFFIYPGSAMLGAYGAWRLLENKTNYRYAAFLVFVPSLVFMITNHPFHHLHFNVLTFREREAFHRRFELDHWGLTYKQGLEYILAHDTAKLIRISSQNVPCDLNVRMLKPEERKRIRMKVIPESDYFLTNFRWHPEAYTEKNLIGREWHAIKVEGKTVMLIFKLK
jgi:hypothetical protein